jgi:hypothetical protein
LRKQKDKRIYETKTNLPNRNYGNLILILKIAWVPDSNFIGVYREKERERERDNFVLSDNSFLETINLPFPIDKQ